MATYIVKKGDTLSAIAAKHGTSVSALVSANGIKNPDRISVGQRINIPEKDNSAAIAAALKETVTYIEALPSYKELCKLLEG